MPDSDGRRRILAIQTQKMPLADDVDLDAVARRTDRFTGADLEDVVRRAGLVALRRSLQSTAVTMADFDAALTESRARRHARDGEGLRQIAARLKQDAAAIHRSASSRPDSLQSRGGKADH